LKNAKEWVAIAPALTESIVRQIQADALEHAADICGTQAEPWHFPTPLLACGVIREFAKSLVPPNGSSSLHEVFDKLDGDAKYIIAQHQETGRMLKWPRRRPLPKGYGKVPNIIRVVLVIGVWVLVWLGY